MAGHKLEISKTYLRFFVKNCDSRWVLCQGGRRSGKSFSIIRWMWFLASAYPNSELLMVAASYPALTLLIQDFQRATPLVVEGSQTYGFNCKMSNGSRFIFKSFDTPEKAQGTTATYMFIDELLNISEDIVTTLSMSVEKQIFAAFNPTRSNPFEKYVLPDRSNILKTTFKDNDFLTDAQREEFEDIKKRAMLPTASILDQYQYKVYYCGDFSEIGGRVFPLIYNCSEEEYESIHTNGLLGLDFGWVDGNDQTALVEGKIWNNCLYLKQKIFSNTLADDRKLAYALRDLGIDEYTDIVADYGGLGRTRIHNLNTAMDGQWTDGYISHGFAISNAKKGRIVDGLQSMLNYDRIYVTEESVELKKELSILEMTPSGTVKGEDHLVDAARYIVTSWYNFRY